MYVGNVYLRITQFYNYVHFERLFVLQSSCNDVKTFHVKSRLFSKEYSFMEYLNRCLLNRVLGQLNHVLLFSYIFVSYILCTFNYSLQKRMERVSCFKLQGKNLTSLHFITHHKSKAINVSFQKNVNIIHIMLLSEVLLLCLGFFHFITLTHQLHLR